jgi:hypothetical protein
LDKVFSGLSAQAQEETVTEGIAELRRCVELIRQSERPADHEQLDGVEKVLALLAPPDDAAPAIPMPKLALSAAPVDTSSERRARVQSGVAGAPRRAAAQSPALDFGAAPALIVGYQAKLHALHVVASEPLFALLDLDEAAADLEKQVSAIKWMGRDRIPEILRVSDTAKSLAERLAAGAALVHLGEARGAEMVMGLLGKAASEKQPLPEASRTLLRTLADQNLTQWLKSVFLLPAHPTVCGLLLPLLVEHNLLTAEQLWRLLGHAKDEIAVPAAEALVWSDGDFDAGTLVAQVEQARTSRRANALLFAATVLGSGEALAEVRARVQGGDTVDGLLLEALAVAGDASDAAILTRMAQQSEEDAESLLLAAANLGSAETLKALPALQEKVSTAVLAQARCMIAGDCAAEGRANAGVRMLHGQPWSVAGVLGRLKALDETVQAHRRMAIELRARTGQVPPSALPTLLSASDRCEQIANWDSCYSKSNGRLKPGQWYCQGRTMNSVSKGASA